MHIAKAMLLLALSTAAAVDSARSSMALGVGCLQVTATGLPPDAPIAAAGVRFCQNVTRWRTASVICTALPDRLAVGAYGG